MRALLVLLLPALAVAEWNGGIPGSYLRFGGSARSMAMGGLDVVLGHGDGAAYGNPAQIGLLARRELCFTHASLFEGTTYTVATAALPSQSWGGLHVAIVSLRCDGFERRGELDNRPSFEGEEFGVSQTAFMVGWGQDFARMALGTSVGARLKVVTHSMLDELAVGVGADVGLEHRLVLPYLHRIAAPLAVGVTVSNLLAPRSTLAHDAETMARRVDLGLSYERAPWGSVGIQACVWGEATRPVVVGIEGWPREELAVRLGANERGMTAGLGVRWRGVGIDYGVAWHDELGTTHRFSLVLGRVRLPKVDPSGEVRVRDAPRWIVQHYRDQEAAPLAHRVAQGTGGGRASRMYRYVVGQHPTTVWAAHGWRWFGDRSYERGDWSGAESSLMRLLRHPQGAEVAEPVTWFRLGDAGERLGHWRTAVDGYERVMAEPEESSWREEAYFRAGAIYFLRLRDYPATVRVYEEAVRRYPSHDLADAYFALGRSWAALQRWQTCLERFDTFLDRFPSDPRVPQALFWSGRALYEMGLPEEAVVRLERVVEGYPQDDVADDAILFKGHCWRLSGELARARLEYARVVKDYPGRDAAPQAQLALAYVLLEEGAVEAAAREFRRFLTNYPTHSSRPEAEGRLRELGG